jgi:hypothetical protein
MQSTVFVVCVGLLSFIQLTHAVEWPAVQPMRRTFTFTATDAPKDFPVSLLVRAKNSTPVYRLECHSGDYEGEFVIYYSGRFHCALFAVRDGKISSWNLLADGTKDEQSSDWYNRGRMIDGQLFGACGAFQEYGVLRRFRTRGMLITFQFTNLKWRARGEPKLQEFTFTVTIAQDATAISPTSERVAVARPPASCLW